MGGVEEPDFIRRLRERQGTIKVEVPTWDADLVPEVDSRPRSEEDSELDATLERVDIIEAYRRWCGKMEPNPGSRREGIKISCPRPSHPDEDPSAWINTDKQTWFCGGCQVGGDMYDLAAYHHGYDVPGYKTGAEFPKLRRQMAEDLGYIVKRTLAGQEYLEQPSPPETPVPTEASEMSNVVAFPTALDVSFEQRIEDESIFIDWEEIVKPDTFLWHWMKSCTIDDLPHEYYFWLGLQAIAFAAGTDQLLGDFQDVKANLYVCIYGSTGSGKSRALAPYVKMLEDALPYEEDPFDVSHGTRILSSPASAEALLKMFVREVQEPSTMTVTELAQVRGLLRIEEFASFIARASRSSNPMKETLIELYDILNRDMKHTSIGGGTLKAHSPFCQMVTTTQPAAIHDFLRRTDAHSGFLNRWVFATGKRRRDRISYGGVRIDTTAATTLLRSLHIQCRANPTTHELTGDALTEWDNFFQTKIVPLHDSTDESMFSRIDLMLKKLILIFTLNDGLSTPNAEVVQKATSLYPYLHKTYMMFSSDIAFDESEDCRTQIIEASRPFGATGITLRELDRKLNARFPKTLVLQTLNVMIQLDELDELVSDNKKGPKTKRYRYAG